MGAYLERLKAEMTPLYEVITELEGLPTLSDSQRAEFDSIVAQLDGMKADYDAAAARSTKAMSFGEALQSMVVSKPRAQRDGRPSGEAQEATIIQRLSDRVAETAEYKARGLTTTPISLGNDVLKLLVAYGATGIKAAWVPTGVQGQGGPIALFGPNTPRVRHRLLELIPSTPWGAMGVPYLAPAFTNNAAIVAMGAAKPESTNAGNVATANMETVAHWKDVPRQLLRYLPGLRQMLDDELIGGLESELEDEIVNGAGTTGHFRGLLTAITATGTGDDLVTATLSGIGLVETAGGSVDGVVMNPADYWGLVALAYTDNKYSPIVAGGRFLGLPTALVTALASGKTVVGDFTRGVRLYDGESANVRTAEPRAKENIVTLIAELDAALVVGRPSFFAENTAPLVPVTP